MEKRVGKVLIVDDDKDVLMLLSFHLETAGYEPVTALDGRSALAAAAHDTLSLIILDLMLPEFNGWEICRCFRREEKTKGVPVMIVSALSDDESRQKAMAAGADDYVTKPFSPKELVARAIKLIAEKSAGAGVPAAQDH